MHRDATNVEHEMCVHTGSNWSHRNCNKIFKANQVALSGKHSADLLQKTVVLGTSHIKRNDCRLKLVV
jgi:hypothetical protein